MFFLTNYKGILHILSIMIFFGISYLFTDFLSNPVYDLVLLVSCFFITNFSIKYVGLDVAIEKELNKIAKEKSDK